MATNAQGALHPIQQFVRNPVVDFSNFLDVFFGDAIIPTKVHFSAFAHILPQLILLKDHPMAHAVEFLDNFISGLPEDERTLLKRHIQALAEASRHIRSSDITGNTYAFVEHYG